MICKKPQALMRAWGFCFFNCVLFFAEYLEKSYKSGEGQTNQANTCLIFKLICSRFLRMISRAKASAGESGGAKWGSQTWKW